MRDLSLEAFGFVKLLRRLCRNYLLLIISFIILGPFATPTLEVACWRKSVAQKVRLPRIIKPVFGQIKNFPPFNSLRWNLKPGISYIIGANGVGKTRLIDAVKAGRLTLHQVEAKKPSHITSVSYMYHDWEDFIYDDLNEAKNDYANIDRVLEIANQSPLDTEEIEHGVNATRNDQGKVVTTSVKVQVHRIHGVDFNSCDMLSKGTKFLFDKLNWRLPNVGQRPDRFKKTRNIIEHYFVFLEEPENSLHPDVQKLVPGLLREWYAKNTKSGKKVYLVVTTHSPFIVKAISESDSKLDQCFLLQTGTSSLEPLNKKQAVTHGNFLLGAGIGDLVPGQILLAENSVAKLLETVSENLNLDIPSFFVCTAGDGDTDNRVKNIQSIQKMLKNLSKSYPERFMLKMKYLVIYDDKQKKEESENALAQNPINNLEIEYLNLGEECLEDVYPLEWISEYRDQNFAGKADWEKNDLSYTEYCKTVLGLSGRNIGTHKESLALFIAGKIKTMAILKSKLPQVHELFAGWG